METSFQGLISLRATLAAVLLSILAYLLWEILSPFLLAFSWATIITLSTWPLRNALRRKIFPRSKNIHALIIVLGLLLFFVSLISPILFALSREIRGSFHAAQAFFDGETPLLPDFVTSLPVIGYRLQPKLEELWHNRSIVRESVIHYQQSIIPLVTRALQGVVSGAVTLFLVLLTSFFLLRDGDAFGIRLKNAAVNIGGARFEALLHAAKATVRGAIYGVLLTALVQGTLAGIGYFVLDAPFPVLLGFTTIVASLIPFGPPFIYVPVALVLMIQGNMASGWMLLIWGFGVVSSSDNFLRPYFISQSTQMPILLSFMSVLGGIIAFGFIGIVIGPVVAAVAITLWNEGTAEISNEASS